MPHYTTKEDLNKTVTGIEQYKPGDPSTKKLYIAASSGTTTGLPTLLVVKNNEYDEYQYGLRIGGIKQDIRVSANTMFNLRRVAEALYCGEPNRIMCLDRDLDVASSHLSKIIEEFGPTELDGVPSFAVQVIENVIAEDGHANVFTNIRTFFTVGEALTPTKIAYLTKLMPKITFQGEYGCAEGGSYIAFSCPTRFPEENEPYHVVQNIGIRVEIEDPDEDGFGEIVVSTPAITRYRTGDAGKIVPGICECGAQDTLVVRGRIDFDIVHCRGATFLISEIDRVFGNLRPYVADYLVEVDEHAGGGTLIGTVSITIVPTEKLREHPTASRFICDTFSERLYVTKTRTLAQLVEDGLFKEPEVHFREKIVTGTKKKIRLRKKRPDSRSLA